MKTYRILLADYDHIDVQAEYYNIDEAFCLDLIRLNDEGLEDYIATFRPHAWHYLIELNEKDVKNDQKKAKK